MYELITKDIEEFCGTVPKKPREKIGVMLTGSENNQIIGSSKPMQELYKDIKILSEKDKIDVLIRGETGTGKNLVAEAIHYRSKRKHKPFIRVNISSLQDSLLVSELFGHKRGAFTGAQEKKVGYVESAGDGTVFLDEIGDLSPDVQSKLLRLVENKEYFAVGKTKPQKTTARFLYATNQNLEKKIFKKEFREDLYYRLNAVNLHVPSLRKRKGDIPELIEYFFNEFNTDGKRSMEDLNQYKDLMLKYPYPGNVRELRNIILKYVTLRKIDFAGIEMNGKMIIPNNWDKTKLEDVFPYKAFMREVEIDILTKAYKKAGYQKAKAAKMLGMERTTLVEKFKKYNIKVKKN